MLPQGLNLQIVNYSFRSDADSWEWRRVRRQQHTVDTNSPDVNCHSLRLPSAHSDARIRYIQNISDRCQREKCIELRNSGKILK